MFLFRLAGVGTYTDCVRTLNIEFVNVFLRFFIFKRGYMLGVLCFYPIQPTTFINTCQWISIKHFNKSIQNRYICTLINPYKTDIHVHE